MPGIIRYGDYTAQLVSRRAGGTVADTTALAAIPERSRCDGMVVFVAASLTPHVFDADASSGDVAPGTGTGYWLAAGGGRVQKLTATILETALTDAVNGEAETENVGSALPTNAVVLAAEIYLTTQFTGGSVSAVTVDVGIAGETEALVKDFDALGSTAAAFYASGASAATRPRGNFSAGQIIATFTPDGSHALASLTAGSLTVNVYYVVPVD